MCVLPVDVQVEAGTVTADFNSPNAVVCAEGRVIIAASGWVGNTGSAYPVAAILDDGDPVDTVHFECSGAGTSHGSTLRYYLTTVRVATL